MGNQIIVQIFNKLWFFYAWCSPKKQVYCNVKDSSQHSRTLTDQVERENCHFKQEIVLNLSVKHRGVHTHMLPQILSMPKGWVKAELHCPPWLDSRIFCTLFFIQRTEGRGKWMLKYLQPASPQTLALSRTLNSHRGCHLPLRLSHRNRFCPNFCFTLPPAAKSGQRASTWISH